MQAAARKVAWENARLRELLVSRGVPAEEIDDLVHAEERTDSKPTSSSVCRPCRSAGVNEQLAVCSSGSDRPVSRIEIDIGGYASKYGQDESDECPSSVTEEQHVPLYTESAIRAISPTGLPLLDRGAWTASSKTPKYTENGCVLGNSDSSTKLDNERHDLLPAISDCFCPANSNVAPYNTDRLMLEMSCETAAKIIVGMRGHGDVALARSELGCAEEKNCNVKNIHVLQIMDRDK